MAMNELTRKWRNSRDDKFSLPTLDDSRPIDTQGLSLSLSLCLVTEKDEAREMKFQILNLDILFFSNKT
jgi:hypothetical protein